MLIIPMIVLMLVLLGTVTFVLITGAQMGERLPSKAADEPPGPRVPPKGP